MKNNYLAKQKRQFKGLCKKISKNWDNFSSQERENLLARFRRLYGKLKSAFARPALRKMMGAAALVLMSMGGVQAQQFAAPVADTFNMIGSAGLRGKPSFVDFDGDGDYDILSGLRSGGFLIYYNLGDSLNPNFPNAGAYSNPSGLADLGMFNEASAPAFVDIDNDGDMDMFSGYYNGNFFYFENTGSATSPHYATAVRDTFGLTDVYTYSTPAFVDIDGDGDMDMFSGDYYGGFFFYENVGTTSAPSFAAAVEDTFGLSNIGTKFSTPTFVDLDEDGDMDMLSGGHRGVFYYFENIGTSTAPSFATAVQNPFGLSDIGSHSSPTFADLDGDGDLDLLSGQYYLELYYFEQIPDTTTNIEESAEFALGVQLFPNPVSNELKVELPISANYQIRITDLTGREVYNEFVQGDKNLQLSTKTWPAGLYLLQVRDEEGNVETKKIVKQ